MRVFKNFAFREKPRIFLMSVDWYTYPYINRDVDIKMGETLEEF